MLQNLVFLHFLPLIMSTSHDLVEKSNLPDYEMKEKINWDFGVNC